MKFKNFELEIVDKEILILSLNTENSDINTINKVIVDELNQIIEEIKKNDNIKGIILNSLKKDFHHGYDLEQILNINNTKNLFNLILKQNHNLRSLESLGKKVISIHKGKTFSGGLEIALASHYRIANDSHETTFAIKDLNFGLCMGMGGTQRLPRIIGISQTIDLILSKKVLSASDALDLKIIDEIVEEEKLINRAKEIILSDVNPIQPWDDKKIDSINLKPFKEKNLAFFIGTIAKTHSIAQNHYPGVKTFLSCIFEGLNTNIDSGLKIESRNFVWLLNHQETRAMITTLIINKPKKDIKKSEFQDFKIILNRNYAAEGIRLLLEGISPALIENAGKRIGFSDGPLAEADNLEIKSIITQLNSSDANVTALIGLMDKKNRKGKSNKAGFYDYDDTERKKLWEGLSELVATSKVQPEVSEIEKRLIFIIINEFSHKANDYIKNFKTEEQDYFSIKNCGFPAWTGGPYSWLKQYGIKKFIKTSNQYSERLGPRFIPSKNILELK